MRPSPLHFDYSEVDVFLTSSYSSKKSKSTWAAYIVQDGQTKIQGAALHDTTWYAAHLIGTILILEQFVPQRKTITIHSSSNQFLKGVNERLSKWAAAD